MGAYIQIQTYTEVSSERDLYYSFVQFRQLLERFGYPAGAVEEWLSEFAWTKLETEGFGGRFLGRTISVLGTEFGIEPYVNGYARSSISGLVLPWVEFELLFEEENLTHSPYNSSYKPGVGKGLWQIMREVGMAYKETGVYLTNEVGDGQPWKSLLTGKDDLWSFDLALVPYHLAPRFSSIPNSYVKAPFDYGIGLSRAELWSNLPWEER